MLFGGEGSSFVAAIAVSVLLSGMLLYYFNIRLRALERTAQKQNQVLAGFLGGVQGNLVHGELHAAGQVTGMSGGSCARPAQEASAAAQCFGGVCQLRPAADESLGRIPVSDDESEGSETDSAEEYTDDSDDSASEGDDVIDLGRDDDSGVKVIDLDSDPTPAPGEGMHEGEHLVADTIEVLKGAVEASVESNKGDRPGEDGEQEIENIDSSSDGAASAQAGDDGEGDESETVIERLKVGELRDLAVSKSLATAAEARGMKKAMLIKLLEPSAEAATSE